MQSEPKLTALEEKWQKEEKTSKPSLNDAYTEDGKVKDEGIEQNVLDLIPQPTGWRLALLPYRGAATTKGGIMLAKENAGKNTTSYQCRVCVEGRAFGIRGCV